MILIQVLLVGILLGVGALVLVARSNMDQQERNNGLLQEILKNQLNPRTRISQIEVQSGPVSELKMAKRVGRATHSKRVVVGGEPEAELNVRMNRPNAGDEDE